jgi:hypothetical protein
MPAVSDGGTVILTTSTEKRSIHLPVPAAEKPSQPMETVTVSTAPTPVISKTGSKVVTDMNDEQFEREKLYQASMEMFHAMLDHGLITEEEYAFIDTKMREKYSPIIGTLLSP